MLISVVAEESGRKHQKALRSETTPGSNVTNCNGLHPPLQSMIEVAAATTAALVAKIVVHTHRKLRSEHTVPSFMSME
jgi:hypothetical protein